MLIQSCFYHLRNISRIRPFLSAKNLETVTQAVITSHLDYWNTLLPGINKKSVSNPQLIQNSAARILTWTKKQYHISPILAPFHWLPVGYRIDFNILLITHRAQRGLALTYLSDLFIAVCPIPPPEIIRYFASCWSKAQTDA